MAALEEEEEQASCSRDHMDKKEAHTYHSSVISSTWLFGEMSRVLLQGHELLRLGAQYRLMLPTVETL
jgi:hypothetical protein